MSQTRLKSPKDNIEIENRLAEAMIKVILKSADIKRDLQMMGAKVQVRVLGKIKEALENKDVTQLSDLSKPMQDAIKHLALHQSATGKHWGSVMAELNEEQISGSMVNIKILVARLEDSLNSIVSATTVNDAMMFFQVLCDLFVCYIDKLKYLHENSEFDVLYQYMWPLKSEFDIRIKYVDIGKEAQLTHGTGICTVSGVDLISASSPEAKGARTAGKTVFAIVGTQAYFEQITKQYDSESDQLKLIETRLRTAKENSSDATIILALQNEYDSSVKKFKKITEQMDEYKIPYAKDRDLDKFVRKHLSTFEKLRRVAEDVSHAPVPLIASTSGTTARAFITLHHLGSFLQEDGSIHFNKIQSLSNFFMACLIHGGHHSYIEVAEIYNRFIDYIAIVENDKLPMSMRCNSEEEMLEEKLPYYKLGDYRSFLKSEYADLVIKIAELNSELSLTAQRTSFVAKTQVITQCKGTIFSLPKALTMPPAAQDSSLHHSRNLPKESHHAKDDIKHIGIHSRL